MLCLTTVYKDISQNIHFDVVLSEFIHPCSKKRRRAQFSIRAELTRLCVCMRFRCAFRQKSRAFYMLASCLRAVLISSPDTWDWTRMHALVVIHRRTLCENVDSAKIKVPFILQISIFYVWHRWIVSSYIVLIYRSISMNRYTPNCNNVNYVKKNMILRAREHVLVHPQNKIKTL